MKEHEAIHQELLMKRDVLRERLSRITNDLRQKKNADFEDQATERENDTVLAALEKSMHKELEQIETALEQMKKGVYGLCSTCGQEISDKRLQVLPYTNLCVLCATG